MFPLSSSLMWILQSKPDLKATRPIVTAVSIHQTQQGRRDQNQTKLPKPAESRSSTWTSAKAVKNLLRKAEEETYLFSKAKVKS